MCTITFSNANIWCKRDMLCLLSYHCCGKCQCLGVECVCFNVPHKSVLVSEKAVFRPSDEAVFTTLGVNTHLFACEPLELESLVRTTGKIVM